MRRTMIFALAGLALAGPLPVAAAPAVQKEATAADGQVQLFLATLKAGKGGQAVEELMAASPLWAKHAGFSEQMTGQIDAAVKAYGPVISYERVSTTNVGTMATREYSLVQHRDMVTRWEFDLVRTPSGWNVGFFGFTDQPNTWFS